MSAPYRTYRQFFITDLGHDEPAILLTNDANSTAVDGLGCRRQYEDREGDLDRRAPPPLEPTRVRDCLSIYLDVDSLPRFFGHIDISLGYSGRRHCNPEPD